MKLGFITRFFVTIPIKTKFVCPMTWEEKVDAVTKRVPNAKTHVVLIQRDQKDKSGAIIRHAPTDNHGHPLLRITQRTFAKHLLKQGWEVFNKPKAPTTKKAATKKAAAE